MQSPRAFAPSAADAEEFNRYPPSPTSAHAAGFYGASSSSVGECAACAHSPAAAAAASRARLAVASGMSPRQAYHQAQDDIDFAPSPRNESTPRPSFVPPLQLGGLTVKLPQAEEQQPMASPRAALEYLAKLSEGGLTASLSPRRVESPRVSAPLAVVPPDSPSSPTLLAPPKGFGASPGARNGASGKQQPQQEAGGKGGKGGKQMMQQEASVPQPKSMRMQDEGDAHADPSMSLDLPLQGLSQVPISSRAGGAVAGAHPNKASMQQEDEEPQSPRLSTRGARPPPMLALSPFRGDAELEDDDDPYASMVMATPRLSARPTGSGGGVPTLGGGLRTLGGAAGSFAGDEDETGARMTPRSTAQHGVFRAGLALQPLPAANATCAQNVVLTPRGGSSLRVGAGAGAADAQPKKASMQQEASTPRDSSDMLDSTYDDVRDDLDGFSDDDDLPPPPPPSVFPPPLQLGAAAFVPQAASCLTEMRRTSFTEDDAETFEVTVPSGAGPGAVLRLTLPSGEVVEIPVPENALPGDKLSFELSKSSLQAVEMAVSGEQIIFPGKVVKGKKLKRPPTPDDTRHRGPVFEVVVPSGWVPGMHTHFQAQLGEVVAAIPVPEGCEPKAVLHVEAPEGTSKIDIVIPEDAVPGAQFVANVGGQLVNVPCPPHMRPGQTLSVAVAGESALELGEVKVVKNGKARSTPKPPRILPSSPAKKAPNFEPQYSINFGADSPGRAHTGGRQDSPGRAMRLESPGRGSGSARPASPRSASPRPDSPGRKAKPASPKPRQASPMSRIFGSSKGKK